MPRIPFADLPNAARLWVFASDRPLPDGATSRLMQEVDAFLDAWRAHGQPLTCARDWRDDRFLAVAVDQSQESASGCSIDGLFRSLRALEPALGASLLAGGNVFYRDAGGAVRSAARDEIPGLAASGQIGASTHVFDTTVVTVADWRERFETEFGQSWHRQLVPTLAG
jgi:hypothetical protein